MKKLISFLICLLMIFNILPIKTFAEEEQNLEEIIRPQIEAFAKSIDQKDANKKAQDAIIGHGISGNGKKLSVGKSHALTATLMNSELAKECFAKTIEELIIEAENLNMDEIYSLENIMWKIETENIFYVHIYDYNSKRVPFEVNGWARPDDYIKIYSRKVKNANAYDKTLDLIAGQILADVDMKINKIYDGKIVYDISVLITDFFDFSAENGTDLENLLGWIGMLLFEPFEWESKFNFQVEIPVEKPEENKVFGDSDGNGSVDVMDAYFARLVAAKLVVPTAEQIAFCDVDSDGKITAIDANLIRKYALGIIKELPVS